MGIDTTSDELLDTGKAARMACAIGRQVLAEIQALREEQRLRHEAGESRKFDSVKLLRNVAAYVIGEIDKRKPK
jgi:hypothetical protein